MNLEDWCNKQEAFFIAVCQFDAKMWESQRDKMVAFAMGLHSRLGVESVVNCLDLLPLRLIGNYVL